MTDALLPVVETPAVDAVAAAEAGEVPAGSPAVALPRVTVDAGPVAMGKFVEFFAGRIANERTRPAYGAVSPLVRGPGPPARGGLTAPRRRLHPDPPRVRADHEAGTSRRSARSETGSSSATFSRYPPPRPSGGRSTSSPRARPRSSRRPRRARRSLAALRGRALQFEALEVDTLSRRRSELGGGPLTRVGPANVWPTPGRSR